MSPFDSASEDLWKFDVASEKWEQVQVEQEGRPEQRSFHVLQASGVSFPFPFSTISMMRAHKHWCRIPFIFMQDVLRKDD